MTKKYSFVIFTMIVILSFIAVFCAGYYRKDVRAESGKFKMELPVKKACCGLRPVESNSSSTSKACNSCDRD